jgi:L-rhamnose mutarotase
LRRPNESTILHDSGLARRSQTDRGIQTVSPESLAEIIRSIKESGIEDMEIYLRGTRMFMIMEVNQHFSFAAKDKADASNPKVQECENLMWKFQKPLRDAKSGEKWLLMERVFKLEG